MNTININNTDSNDTNCNKEDIVEGIGNKQEMNEHMIEWMIEWNDDDDNNENKTKLTISHNNNNK